jgi:hypothetical protein
MKVKELLEKLKECNPDAVVVTYQPYESSYEPIRKIVAFWSREVCYQEEYGTEIIYEHCAEEDTGSFPTVLID